MFGYVHKDEKYKHLEEVCMQEAKKEKRKRKSFWIIIVAVFLALLGMLGFFSVYFSKVYDIMLEKDMEQMEWTSHFVTKLIHEEIENNVTSLYSSEEFFTHYEEYGKDRILNGLRELKEGLDFERTGIIDLEGNGLDDTGNDQVRINSQFVEQIKQDKPYISNVIDKSDSMILAVPMHKDGEVVGAIWGYYAVSTIAEKIELTENMHQYFQIIDDNGEYISKSGNVYSFAKNLNIWKELSRYQFEDGMSVKQIKENVKAGEKGYFYFSYKGEGRYVTYEPLGINNWYVFSVMVEDFFGDSVKKVEHVFARLLLGLSICIVFVMGIIGLFLYRTMRMIREQNQKLQVKNSLLSMILKKTNDIPFEINLQERKMFLYHNNIETEEVDYEVISDITPDTLLAKDVIKKETRERYTKAYQKLFKGEKLDPLIIEMKINQKWNWYRIHTFLVDQNYMVGFFEDYNEIVSQDQKIKEIKKKNQTDPLTGLYTREYFVQTVEILLHQNKQKSINGISALFLLDLDHFKQINDTLGHIMGDQVLHEAGALLKAITRKEDVCGRLGGDEFVLYIQNASDMKAIIKCAEKINAALSMTYGGEEKKVTVTASIGVAVTRNDSDFRELYERADRALYQVKEEKKNGYMIKE